MVLFYILEVNKMKIKTKEFAKIGFGLAFGACLGKTVYNAVGDVVAIVSMTTLHRFVEAGIVKDERLVKDVNEYWDKMHPKKEEKEESED